MKTDPVAPISPRLLGHFDDDPAAAASVERWEHVARALAGEGSARRLCAFLG